MLTKLIDKLIVISDKKFLGKDPKTEATYRNFKSMMLTLDAQRKAKK